MKLFNLGWKSSKEVKEAIETSNEQFPSNVKGGKPY